MKWLISFALILFLCAPCLADITVYGSAQEGVQTGRFYFGADAGSSDTYAVTIQGVSSYSTGMLVVFKAATANTGACSLNINGLGAKAIKKLNDQDPGNNCLEAGSHAIVTYDGTNFQLHTPCAN